MLLDLKLHHDDPVERFRLAVAMGKALHSARGVLVLSSSTAHHQRLYHSLNPPFLPYLDISDASVLLRRHSALEDAYGAVILADVATMTGDAVAVARQAAMNYLVAREVVFFVTIRRSPDPLPGEGDFQETLA